MLKDARNKQWNRNSKKDLFWKEEQKKDNEAQIQ